MYKCHYKIILKNYSKHVIYILSTKPSLKLNESILHIYKLKKICTFPHILKSLISLCRNHKTKNKHRERREDEVANL